MIDRAKIRKAKDNQFRWFPGLGKGKPWRKSWFVLMGLLQSATDEQFAAIEPRFKRAYDDFGFWMAKFKQDPRQHEAGPDSAYYFRDTEFARAFKILMEESERTRLLDPAWRPGDPVTRQREIGRMIRSLRDKVAYLPK